MLIKTSNISRKIKHIIHCGVRVKRFYISNFWKKKIYFFIGTQLLIFVQTVVLKFGWTISDHYTMSYNLSKGLNK